MSQDSDEDARNIQQMIQLHVNELDEIEDRLSKLFESNETDKEIINTDIRANHVILNNDAFISSIQSDYVNGFEAGIFKNVLDIGEGFEIDSIEFDFLSLSDKIFPRTVNDLPVDSFLHKRDLVNIDNLVVDGVVEFLSDLNVRGSINNATLSSSNTLLKNGDQNFRDFTIRSVEIGDLQIEILNGFKLNVSPQKTKNTNELKELKAKKVILGGYINNMDLATLEKYALKVNGTQKITKKYYFHKIEADNLDVNMLSDKAVLDDFVIVTRGKYRVNKDAKFTEELTVNNLKALKHLDGIPVKNGTLDVLRKDSSERQYIPGVKSFENLKLLNPIQLRYKIRSKILDTMNPRVTIDEDIDLHGDVRITGGVTAEEIVKSNDVVAFGGAGALRRVQLMGLKLTDAEIPAHLDFSEGVNAEGVFAERINSVDTDSWVVNGGNRTQIVRGSKLFQGDLEITGDTEVLMMNDVDLVGLERNVLKLNGDQVISGRHYVEMVVTEKG